MKASSLPINLLSYSNLFFQSYDVIVKVYNEILAEEEATALSVWAISCLCGSLRLENVNLS